MRGVPAHLAPAGQPIRAEIVPARWRRAVERTTAVCPPPPPERVGALRHGALRAPGHAAHRDPPVPLERHLGAVGGEGGAVSPVPSVTSPSGAPVAAEYRTMRPLAPVRSPGADTATSSVPAALPVGDPMPPRASVTSVCTQLPDTSGCSMELASRPVPSWSTMNRLTQMALSPPRPSGPGCDHM